jgi:lipopolysaccharide transport system permease protein
VVHPDKNRLSTRPRTTIIEEGRAVRHYWRELWEHRELVYFLAWRDVLVRYKQTVIGVAWSVVRPVLTMLALTWVFGRGAHLRTPSPSIPYSLWVFVGTLPWQFFSDGLTASSGSLISNSNMVSKVYFPRLILPASRVFVSFIDFAVAFGILLALMVGYHFTPYHFIPSWRLIFVPVFLGLTFLTANALGFWFAALNVRYRDFMYIVPFIVTFGLYVSPVGLSSDEFTHGNHLLRVLFSINPMVGVIDGFRWCAFGNSAPLFWRGQAASLLSMLFFLTTGVQYFRRAEAAFADFI